MLVMTTTMPIAATFFHFFIEIVRSFPYAQQQGGICKICCLLY